MELELARIRGWNLEPRDGYYSNGETAVVHISDKMNKSSAIELHERISERHLVIIYDDDTPSPHCVTVLEPGRDLELIGSESIRGNVLNHSDQPRYRVVDRPGQHPIMLTSSPVARLYGWKSGTVVEAVCLSATGGILTKYYLISGPAFRKMRAAR
jgi:hypothetical protein